MAKNKRIISLNIKRKKCQKAQGMKKTAQNFWAVNFFSKYFFGTVDKRQIKSPAKIKSIFTQKMDEIYSEQMITDKLQVSRTPVRETILQLRFENLVDVFSGRGFSVRLIHFFDVQQIIQARTAIESASLRALIIGLDTREGQEILKQMEICVKQDMPAAISDENNYNFMRTQQEQAIVSSLKKQNRTLAAIDEHEKIFSAVKRRDTDGAIRALVDHMNMTENILHEMMAD